MIYDKASCFCFFLPEKLNVFNFAEVILPRMYVCVYRNEANKER